MKLFLKYFLTLLLSVLFLGENALFIIGENASSEYLKANCVHTAHSRQLKLKAVENEEGSSEATSAKKLADNAFEFCILHAAIFRAGTTQQAYKPAATQTTLSTPIYVRHRVFLI